MVFFGFRRGGDPLAVIVDSTDVTNALQEQTTRPSRAEASSPPPFNLGLAAKAEAACAALAWATPDWAKELAIDVGSLL